VLAHELGFGPGLIRVLQVFALDERRLPAPRHRAPRLASHPSCQARIDAVRRWQAAP
jgi:hypothetical protein